MSCESAPPHLHFREHLGVKVIHHFHSRHLCAIDVIHESNTQMIKSSKLKQNLPLTGCTLRISAVKYRHGVFCPKPISPKHPGDCVRPMQPFVPAHHGAVIKDFDL